MIYVFFSSVFNCPSEYVSRFSKNKQFHRVKNYHIGNALEIEVRFSKLSQYWLNCSSTEVHWECLRITLLPHPLPIFTAPF